MDADHLAQTARDAGGGRVLEAFLCSDSSAHQKVKVIGRQVRRLRCMPAP